MTEREFAELRPYRDGYPTDMGYRPMASVIRKGWLREVVRGAWQITPRGIKAFDEMRTGSRT